MKTAQVLPSFFIGEAEETEDGGKDGTGQDEDTDEIQVTAEGIG